ncbi:unnamed protein product [Brassica oleracea]
MMEFNIVFISRKANAVQTLIDENRRTGSCVDMTRVSITNGVRVKLRETMSEFHRFRERIFAEYIEDGSTFLATGEDPSNEDMEKMISGNGLVWVSDDDTLKGFLTFVAGELCEWRRRNQKFFLCEPGTHLINFLKKKTLKGQLD